jgi:tRNA pseudouridine38-40 synthase
VKSPVRTIGAAQVAAAGALCAISVSANGFLYNMVRIIAGTLAYVGCGKLEPGDVSRMLERPDRLSAGMTAPACGLYLAAVEYAELDAPPESEERRDCGGLLLPGFIGFPGK